MKIHTFLVGPAVALSLLASQAQAAPITSDVAAAAVAASASGSIEQVQFRGRGRGFGGGWRGRGWGGGGPWLGVGAGIVAGALIYDYAYRPRAGYYYDTYDYHGPYYYPADYKGDPRDICARNFKSFNYRTGLYTTYGGEKRLCPYLANY